MTDFLADLPPERLLAALALITGWLGLCAGLAWRHRQHQRARADQADALARRTDPDTPVALVAWASQTGTAEALAWQTAATLQARGTPARVAPLDQLDPDTLRRHEPVLFIAATAGEGDPPDHASRFAERWMPQPAALDGLPCAVLALGDRDYPAFCGFGRQLAHWLGQSGAQALFDPVWVDKADPAALAQWRQRLGGPDPVPAGADDGDDAAAMPPTYQPWLLAGRRALNPGSQGEPVWLIDLLPADAHAEPPVWQAGDLVQLRLDGDDRRPRSYSLASLPEPGGPGLLQLLVRRHRREDGSVGRASGWLTEGCPVGGLVSLRLQPHPAFRLPARLAQRPLVLIGNGTGLAGLRAHLLAAEQALAPLGSPRHALVAQGRHAWLLYGERQAAHDALCDHDITHWLASGVLSRTDRVYSRDGGPHRYVQDRLRAEGARLQAWVDDGAVILVCGSRQGMAAGVDDVLREVLGDAGVDALRAEGRLRLDVY